MRYSQQMSDSALHSGAVLAVVPDDALGRAYGEPTAAAFDIEWYATAPPDSLWRIGCQVLSMRSSMATGSSQCGHIAP